MGWLHIRKQNKKRHMNGLRKRKKLSVVSILKRDFPFSEKAAHEKLIEMVVISRYASRPHQIIFFPDKYLKKSRCSFRNRRSRSTRSFGTTQCLSL